MQMQLQKKQDSMFLGPKMSTIVPFLMFLREMIIFCSFLVLGTLFGYANLFSNCTDMQRNCWNYWFSSQYSKYNVIWPYFEEHYQLIFNCSYLDPRSGINRTDPLTLTIICQRISIQVRSSTLARFA